MTSRFTITRVLTAALACITQGCAAVPTTREAPDVAIIHRPRSAVARNAQVDLPQAAAITTLSPIDDPIATFAAALQDHPVRVPRGTRVTLLATGPLLDSADEVAVRAITRDRQTITVEIVHTRVRADGAALRNVRWRPLVELPLPAGTDAGAVDIRILWIAVDAVPSGADLGDPPSEQHATFTVAG